MRFKALTAAVCFAAVSLAPTAAGAHTPLPGIEGFYVGLVHPLSNFAQLLALLALGVMLGHSFRKGAAGTLATLAVGLVIGIALGQLSLTVDWWHGGLLAVAVAAAAISALFPGPPVVIAVIFALAVGVLVGIASTPDPGPPIPTVITLSGSFVGASIFVLYVAGGVDWLRRTYTQQWVHIGIRVVAAWIGAISVLMTALTFAGS